MRINRRWRVVLVSFAALFLIAPARPVFVDPAFVFVEVDGVSRGAFAGIDGPGLEIDVVEFREGGDEGPARKLPGRTKYLNITLKRGWVAASYFEDWIQQVSAGEEGFRKNVDIVIANRAGREIGRYSLINAWPAKWTLTNLPDDDSTTLFEEVTLTTESYQKAP
jgi:phage tail-like protein